MYLASRVDYRLSVKLAPAAYIFRFFVCCSPAFRTGDQWIEEVAEPGAAFLSAVGVSKVAVILFLVWQISNTKSKTTGFWFICRTMMTLLPVAGLVGSNNLSTAVIILGIGVLLIFVANPRYLQFLALGGAGIGFIAVFLPRRVIVWNAWQSGGIRKI